MKQTTTIYRAVLLAVLLSVQFFVYTPQVYAQGSNTPPSNTPANNSQQSSNSQATYVGKGAEASIRALLCAPSDSSNATVNGTGYGTGGVNAQVQNNPAGEDLANCINRGYRFAIAFGAVAAVFFVVLAGYMYMVGGEKGKHEAKSIIVSVLAGFLIILSSFVLLRQINPTLVEFRTIQPPQISGTYGLLSCAQAGLGEDCVLPGGVKAVGNGYGGGTPVGSGSCKAINNPASGCDVNKLKGVCNWNPESASAVCNKESAGGTNPSIGGQADKCYINGPSSPGVPMSIGYFQISLFGSYSPEFDSECKNVIVEDKSGCYEWKTLPKSGLKYCAKRKCSLPRGQAAYDACVAAIANQPARHYKQACTLFKRNGNKFANVWFAANECKIP